MSAKPTYLALCDDFRDGTNGWRVDFADYPVGQEEFFELEYRLRDLPDEVEPSGTALYVQGNNHSDDLFMYLKRQVGSEEGVEPSKKYIVTFVIVFASNAQTGCPGVGGAEGEGVTLKAGGSAIEPDRTVDGLNHYRMNVDKGNQIVGGADASTASNIANGLPCQSKKPYVSITRSHRHKRPITASDDGTLWLLIGTDSGFEATTALYYQRIEVRLDAVV